MATKKKQREKASRSRRETEAAEPRAPAGRGGVAMGRTVGLPFGGARPRKRKAKASSKSTEGSRKG